MITNLEQMMRDDPGIDLDNFSIEEEIEKYKQVNPSGYQILVRIYVPDPLKIRKTAGGLILPDSTVDQNNRDAKFTNLVGLVIKFGPGVYKDKNRYEFTGYYCQIGDWVQFPRANGHSFAHNKLSSLYLIEDQILGRVDDPSTISRIT
jgi:co-chaperonin GroES (HSP10)